MLKRLVPLLLILLALSCRPGVSSGGVTFQVDISPMTTREPVSGRLLVYLVDRGSPVRRGWTPAHAPFFDDMQPLFAMDIENLVPGQGGVIVDDNADAFPFPPSRLPRGEYTVQAVIERDRTNSRWNRQPGTLFSMSSVHRIVTDANPVIKIDITEVVSERGHPGADIIDFVEIPSALLSEFHGRPVSLRAAVAKPIDFNPERPYPAVYFVPGFGGDHFSAARLIAQRQAGEFRPGEEAIQTNAFAIFLDPESPNGHTLFADSENNGPVSSALIDELIPELESRYPLIPEASARLVAGHSSGGWTSVWLAVTAPDTFGGCFASAPDPVDFRAFQKINIYSDPNMYTTADGAEIASNERNGKVLMTIRQENQWEEARGPDNTSAQQWDSWQAVFGPRNERGNPAALFDPRTGEINRDLLDHYRAYDIAHQLRNNPDRLGPVFARGVRILVGGSDEWNLHEAVRLLHEDLKRLGYPMDADPGAGGSITIVPGLNHSSITRSMEAAATPGKMLEAFRAAGHVPNGGAGEPAQ